MLHVGYTAAKTNIFLEIPIFLRSMCQSLHGQVGPLMSMDEKISKEMEIVDPFDPTCIVDEYLYDWWNHEVEWKTHSQNVDHDAAHKWHIQKVKFYFIYLTAFIIPDGQYGYHKNSTHFDDSPAPESTAINTCKSEACKDRLYHVLGEIQKANQVVQSLTSTIEGDRLVTIRHILHLKALKRHMIDTGKTTLTMADVEEFYEKEKAIESTAEKMQDILPSTGPSSGPSLSSQSLSWNGFSDSDSDYIP
jgi:hypothetical protein